MHLERERERERERESECVCVQEGVLVAFRERGKGLERGLGGDGDIIMG